MGRDQKMEIRKLFDYDGEFSQCKQDNCNVKMKGNHNGNLRRHLKHCHNEILRGLQEEEAEENQVTKEPPAMKKKKLKIEMSEHEVVMAALELVAKEGAPLKLLDSKAIRTFTAPICNALNMPLINSHSIVEILGENAEKVRKEIISLANKTLISLKVDSATRHDRSILGINMQVCVKSDIIVKTLAMVELEDRHTATNLKGKILDVLAR